MSSSRKFLPYLLSLCVFPAMAQAHLIGGSGLSSGAAHPLLGLDHLLAMLAVGIIATRYDQKAVWLVPAAFVVAMVVGGALAIAGIGFPFVELGIALSVVFLGAAIFLQKRVPFAATMALVAISAILHGHAHGTEMPFIASPALFTLGFVLSTAAVHFSGVAIGTLAARSSTTTNLLRYAGAGMGAVGIFLLFGV